MNESLRYVVQEHFTDPHHFDMMFEFEGVLWTWSVTAMQMLLSGRAVAAEKKCDHRMKYLDYQGVIPGCGSVKIYTHGHYLPSDLSAESADLEIITGTLQGRLYLKEEKGQWRAQWISNTV